MSYLVLLLTAMTEHFNTYCIFPFTLHTGMINSYIF